MKILFAFLSVLLFFHNAVPQSNHLDQLKNQKIMYVGAASGGVWKSENGGTRWDPVFDYQVTQNIGALAIQQDKPDVVWVGTGEGNPRNSMNLGMGIFKSTDGGENWNHLGLEKTKTIHRIIVHPKDGDVVFVGAMGDPFTPGPDRGFTKPRMEGCLGNGSYIPMNNRE